MQQSQTSRRKFLGSAVAAVGLPTGIPLSALGEPPEPEQQAPYLALQRYIEPGTDGFQGEKRAMEIRAALHQALASMELPLAEGLEGFSPAAQRYIPLAPDLEAAVFNQADGAVSEGWKAWVHSTGSIRRCEFYVLPGDIVQFEVASHVNGRLQYRVGQWKQVWNGEKIVSFNPIEEHVVTSEQPYFRDITAGVLGSSPSFTNQLSRGIPYWRSRLDAASGIDIYGSNGLAVGDIDGDGRDELYVCQPGGLPNRLYKVAPSLQMIDITETWDVGLLDDTSCALFLDLRNTGRQDLVVLRSGGPVLFLNEGGKFTQRDDAFNFANTPAGGFTGMAAADFDRDGRLDLYLCCYVYFQSEAQFTYASPYYDAKNGPPNFLFRNRLNTDGSGSFQDCTAEVGLNENNNRFSFAPAWCDFNDDGWPDLFVANDFGRKNLYVNTKGRFKDQAKEAGVEDIGPGMSANWFDYDNDGKADLYVANMWSDAGQRVVRDPIFVLAHAKAEKEAYQLHTRGNSLYRNAGDGSFHDVSLAQYASFGRWAWSSGGHDLDNDGHAEIFVTCGMLTNTSSKDLMSFFWRQVVAKSPDEAVASPAYQNGWNAINQFVREDYSWSGHEPNVFHIRRGDRYFDASGVSGLDFAEDSRAFAITDVEGDGRPDLILKSRLGPQIRVLQNNCAHENHSIAFQLEGTRSNRDAIGAKIRVDSQTKWLDAGSGFLSQHSKRLIFGLGASAAAKNVRICWPSGERQELTDLIAGRTYFVREGEPNIRSEPFRTQVRPPSTPVVSDNSLALADTWLVEPIPLPEPHAGPGLLVLCDKKTDATARHQSATVIDFSSQPADLRRQYEILRRYLFDWRTSLQTPMSFLLNKDGAAVKVYPDIPDAQRYQSDLAQLSNHQRLALPFPGRYIVEPQRDFFKFGVAFLWAGYNTQALPYLQEKLKRSPDNPRVLQLLAQIYLAQEDFQSAARFFGRAIQIDKTSPECFYGLGLAQARQDRLEDARFNFQQAISLRPDHSDAINDLGALYIRLGKMNDAVAAFRYGLEVSPDTDILYMNLARTYVKLGQMERAREVMQKLLDRKPDNVSARRGLQELSGR